MAGPPVAAPTSKPKTPSHLIGVPKHARKNKPPPVDQYLMPAIVVAAALLLYQFIQGISNEVSSCKLKLVHNL
jgi:hypothetical protein